MVAYSVGHEGSPEGAHVYVAASWDAILVPENLRCHHVHVNRMSSVCEALGVSTTHALIFYPFATTSMEDHDFLGGVSTV